MDLSARDIHEKQFHDAWRGYNQEEVDDFLDRLAETLDLVQRENAALRARTEELDQAVSASRSTEEMLKTTLVSAQHAAEEAIGKAKARAEQLIGEAEERARKADGDARQKISQAESEIRRRSLEADRDHTTRKRELDEGIEKLRAYESELKTKLRTFLEQQQRALKELTDKPPPATRAATPASNAIPGFVRGNHNDEGSADEAPEPAGADEREPTPVQRTGGPWHQPR